MLWKPNLRRATLLTTKNMNTLARAFCTLVLFHGLSQATPELDTLAASIREEVTEAEWQIVIDWKSISLIRKKVQFLNPISLPPVESEEQWWKQRAFTSDYRITVTLDTKLSQEEHDELCRAKQGLIAKRTEGTEPGTRDHYGISKAANGIIRLPSHYLGRYSVYVYSSDDRFFRLRPDSVKVVRDKVVEVLNRSCSEYKTGPKAQQDKPR